jgi:DNA (cytosine-5)-methyltransferase 1
VTPPLLVDYYCCAGGAGMGYHRSGFTVHGVDNQPQPRYPFGFTQADAIDHLTACVDRGNRLPDGRPIAAYHASPPCQRYSGMTACRPGLATEYPDLIGATRALLRESGLPWILENVAGSPLATASDLFGAHGAVLCGRMFGLPLYRHRVFEASFPLHTPPHPEHTVPASKAGHWRPGTIISVAGNCSPISVARDAMGIHWTSRRELGESIPPAYAAHLGAQILDQLEAAA